MASEDNLNKKQFSEPVEENENLFNKYAKRLKSKWMPVIDAGENKWGKIYSKSNLEWHLDNHHTKRITTDPTGNSWTFKRPPATGMRPEEYHNKLHEMEHFSYGNEHQHFVPKDKK